MRPRPRHPLRPLRRAAQPHRTPALDRVQPPGNNNNHACLSVDIIYLTLLQVTPVGPDTVPGQGTPSPATTIRTRAAAPGSPPTALKQEAVTNTSATISWDTPVVANGPVSSYRVSL